MVHMESEHYRADLEDCHIEKVKILEALIRKRSRSM